MTKVVLVPMKTNTIQALIQHNKQQIRDLQLEANYLKHLITDKYWPNADPSNLGVISQKSYDMLNKAKDDLKKINKKIKLLAEIQYSLKSSLCIGWRNS